MLEKQKGPFSFVPTGSNGSINTEKKKKSNTHQNISNFFHYRSLLQTSHSHSVFPCWYSTAKALAVLKWSNCSPLPHLSSNRWASYIIHKPLVLFIVNLPGSSHIWSTYWDTSVLATKQNFCKKRNDLKHVLDSAFLNTVNWIGCQVSVSLWIIW